MASINELCKVGSQAAWGPTESRSLLYNTEQMCTVVYTALSQLNVFYFVHIHFWFVYKLQGVKKDAPLTTLKILDHF